MTKFSFYKIVTAVGLMGVSATALAVDGKDYSALACVPDATRVPAGHANGTLQVYGPTIMNLSTTENLYVSCPFVHDQNNIGGTTLWAYDRTVDGEVSCTIRSEIHNTGGFTIFETPAGGTGGLFVDTEAKSVSFGALSTGNFNFASCVIPKKTAGGAVSHIAGFNVTEN